ncbi:hypothetical protein FOPG_19963, partial [Fusarium oxysporum f. sp. conglutinans race 2 54008]
FFGEYAFQYGFLEDLRTRFSELQGSTDGLIN